MKKINVEYKNKIEQYKQKMTQLMTNSKLQSHSTVMENNNNKSNSTLSAQQQQS